MALKRCKRSRIGRANWWSDQARTSQAKRSSVWRIAASGSPPRMPTGCSTPSSPPNPAAWAWDYRSAVRSSKPTGDGCRRPTMWGRARGFSSYCHCIKRIRHDRGLKIAARPRKRSGTNRLRHRRRCSGADDSKQSFPIDRLEGRAVRFGPRICADQDAGCCSCLVLDIRLPGVSGLDFQAKLAEADIRIPIIFMTGHGDIPMSVKAMKAGAVDFLTKPFRDQDMLDAVTKALERDRKRREDEQAFSGLRHLFESLTPREREVIALVT